MRTLTENGEIFVLVPLVDYEHLMSEGEDMLDALAFDAAIERGEEAFPMALFDAIEHGNHPIKVFREYREIKRVDLAHLVRISPAYLSQLESGVREGSVRMVKAIAAALDIPMDLLT